MHNNAISVNSMHRIRFAQDLALYNLTLSEEIEGFDGAAHVGRWNNDPAWQGVREVAEQLTGDRRLGARRSSPPTSSSSRWSASCSAASWCSRPRRGNGDFVTPTVVGAGEYDYAARDLRYTKAMFELLTNDKEFADHNKATCMDGWLSSWVPQCLVAARELQPLWSQPDAKPPRFEDGLDRAKSRFSGILSDLEPQRPRRS